MRLFDESYTTRATREHVSRACILLDARIEELRGSPDSWAVIAVLRRTKSDLQKAIRLMEADL